mmetsp:Transcript_25056/g.64716  ORF Transcript_25056/g.64716 Transcript_25056/m.64716 type:complete len:130 (-) Transcript_25056:1404-1793(-)
MLPTERLRHVDSRDLQTLQSCWSESKITSKGSPLLTRKWTSRPEIQVSICMHACSTSACRTSTQLHSDNRQSESKPWPPYERTPREHRVSQKSLRQPCTCKHEGATLQAHPSEHTSTCWQARHALQRKV